MAQMNFFNYLNGVWKQQDGLHGQVTWDLKKVYPAKQFHVCLELIFVYQGN